MLSFHCFMLTNTSISSQGIDTRFVYEANGALLFSLVCLFICFYPYIIFRIGWYCDMSLGHCRSISLAIVLIQNGT